MGTATPSTGPERFERLYSQSADPWGYRTSGYEREKYQSTLAALPAGEIGAALEVGCSIGVFTDLLAERCERVVAIDFSKRALALAQSRLGARANVWLLHSSFPDEAPGFPHEAPGFQGDAPEDRWDVIVCSEVLYYLDANALRRAVSWLSKQLRRGACVVAVSWRGVGRDEPLLGEEVHDLLARELAGRHVLDARRPRYRLDRFDGDGR